MFEILKNEQDPKVVTFKDGSKLWHAVRNLMHVW